MARATRHRGDDENRSPYLDALIAAEAEAEKNKKGLWSADKENTGLIRVQELQNELQRSKQFLPFLQRGSRPEGIVEFVASGSRLRVFIPKESVEKLATINNRLTILRSLSRSFYLVYRLAFERQDVKMLRLMLMGQTILQMKQLSLRNQNAFKEM